MGKTAPVVVVGGGQAGLAVSHELTALGVEHTVLERGRVGETWRGRWDSFCLVTPNWSLQLPGQHYEGPDPDGFLPRDEIVAYLEGYARSLAPVQEGVAVTALEAGPKGAFRLQTSAGELEAGVLVLATGAYQRPHRPPAAAELPRDLLVLDAEEYTNPAALPPGGVLVVGSGQTGCQLAEELSHAGREVHLSCGRAPWLPRRMAGRDLIYWYLETGFGDVRVSELPSPAARLIANPQATGHGGGRDLHFRTLQAIGVRLLGHFEGVEGGRARFAPDLAASVAFGDARHAEFCERIRKHCAQAGLPAPELAEPEPFVADPPESVALDGLGAVVFTAGFRPDYERWVRLPAFDEMGFPLQTDGASTVVPGLYFMGVHWLRKRKSSIFCGVGEDAAIVAQQVAAAAAQAGSTSSRQRSPVRSR